MSSMPLMNQTMADQGSEAMHDMSGKDPAGRDDMPKSKGEQQSREVTKPIDEAISDLMQQWIINILVKLFHDVFNVSSSKQDPTFNNFLEEQADPSPLGRTANQLQQHANRQSELEAYQKTQLSHLTEGSGSLLNLEV